MSGRHHIESEGKGVSDRRTQAAASAHKPCRETLNGRAGLVLEQQEDPITAGDEEVSGW